MSSIKLVIAPDQVLQTPAKKIENVNTETKELAKNMLDIMQKYSGIGLAANQVGILQRLIVVKIVDDMNWDLEDEFPEAPDYISIGGSYIMVNPEIKSFSENAVSLKEGCLSVPGTQDYVTRPEKITVQYLDENGVLQTLRAQRWLARCVQHEIDHLNGFLFIDHISKIKRDIAIKKSAKIKKTYN